MGDIEYGFRRDLLGQKQGGLGATALAPVVSAWFVFHGWNTDGVTLQVAFVTTLLNTCVASGRLIGVRSATTSITADRYARYLLEAEFDLEPAT